jgi:hypothetical protein
LALAAYSRQSIARVRSESLMLRSSAGWGSVSKSGKTKYACASDPLGPMVRAARLPILSGSGILAYQEARYGNVRSEDGKSDGAGRGGE